MFLFKNNTHDDSGDATLRMKGSVSLSKPEDVEAWMLFCGKRMSLLILSLRLEDPKLKRVNDRKLFSGEWRRASLREERAKVRARVRANAFSNAPSLCCSSVLFE